MTSCCRESPESAIFPKSHFTIFMIRVFGNLPNSLFPTNAATNQDLGGLGRAIIVATTGGTFTAMDTHKVALAAVEAFFAADTSPADCPVTGTPAYDNPSESLTTVADNTVSLEYAHFAAILKSEW